MPSNHETTALPALDSTTVADFGALERKQILEPRFQGVGRYVLLTEEEIQSAFGEERSWRTFYTRFPAAPGIVGFSPVGFGRGGSQAAVYMLHLRAGMWGHVTFCLLELERNAWRIIGSARIVDI